MAECNPAVAVEVNKAFETFSKTYLPESGGGKSRRRHRISRRSRRRHVGGGLREILDALKSAAAVIVCAVVGEGAVAEATRLRTQGILAAQTEAARAAAEEEARAAAGPAAAGPAAVVPVVPAGPTFAVRAAKAATKTARSLAPKSVLLAARVGMDDRAASAAANTATRFQITNEELTPAQLAEGRASLAAGTEQAKAWIVKILIAAGIADITRPTSGIAYVATGLLQFLSSIMAKPEDILSGVGTAIDNLAGVANAGAGVAVGLLTVAAVTSSFGLTIDIINAIRSKIPYMKLGDTRLAPAEVEAIADTIYNEALHVATIANNVAGSVAERATGIARKGAAGAADMAKLLNRNATVTKGAIATATGEAIRLLKGPMGPAGAQTVVSLLLNAAAQGVDAPAAAAADAAFAAAADAAVATVDDAVARSTAATGPGVPYSPGAYQAMLADDAAAAAGTGAAAPPGQNPLLMPPSGIAAPAAAAPDVAIDAPAPGGIGVVKRPQPDDKEDLTGPRTEGPPAKRQDTKRTGGRRTRRLRRRANRKRAFTRRH